MKELRVIAMVAVVAGVVVWWLMRSDAPVPSPAETVVAATPKPPKPPEPQAASTAAAQSSPLATPVAPATKVTGTVSFRRTDGSRDNLELQVAGGVALWDSAEHRLRVLLMDEALSPAEERQMLGYLKDERLADSGRPYGVLELQFGPDAITLDRGALKSALLTVAGAGGVLHDTADVLTSIQWKGDVKPAGAGTTPARLELAAAGSARSIDASPWQQNWQLSVAVPVVQPSEP